MKFGLGLTSLGLLVSVLFNGAPAASQDAVANFYKGKTIEFVIGTNVGGTYDQWVRVFARHMGKYIPGNPNMLPKNMPGGGHIVATNYMYVRAPRDGTVLASVSRNMPIQEVLGNPSVKFKMGEFNWLGSPELTNRICVSMADSKVKKVEDLFTQTLIVGGAGAGAATSTTPILLSKLLGMNFKLVEGYPVGAAVFLAMERGEVEGLCQTWAGIEHSRPDWISERKLNVLFNMERKPIASLGAPSIHDVLKTEEQRAIVTFYNSTAELGRPIMTTPGVPADRLAALRKAFDDVVKDKQFAEEAEKQSLELHATTWQEVKEVADGILSTPKAIVDQTIAIVGTMSGD